MFDFGIGANITDGAIKRLQEKIKDIDADSVNSSILEFSEKIPLFGVLVTGYKAMTDEEKAEFVKNIMIAGAKLAAKI